MVKVPLGSARPLPQRLMSLQSRWGSISWPGPDGLPTLSTQTSPALGLPAACWLACWPPLSAWATVAHGRLTNPASTRATPAVRAENRVLIDPPPGGAAIAGLPAPVTTALSIKCNALAEADLARYPAQDVTN